MAFKSGKDKAVNKPVKDKAQEPERKAAPAPAAKVKAPPAKFDCSVCGYTRKMNDMSDKPGVCKGCAAKA